MSDNDDWISEACRRALDFLAVLGSDEPEAVADRGRVFDRLALTLDDPAKQHSMLFSLVWLAHCMRTSATGDTEPGVWTFQVHTPFGPMPVDQAPPAIRWVSRWLIACMNGDARAAAGLWFATMSTEAEAEECMSMLVEPLLRFLTDSVRVFLAAGRPLVIPSEAVS